MRSRVDASGTYLVTWSGHGDALGLWRIETSGALTLANSYAYSTWGTPTTSTHNGIGDLGFRFTYVGRHDVQWDTVHGLDLAYMHARTYAPSLGRFLQPDPVAAEANAYAYAENGPVSKVDPVGTCLPCLDRIWHVVQRVWPYAQSALQSFYRWTQRVGTAVSRWAQTTWNAFSRGLSVAGQARTAVREISSVRWTTHILQSGHKWTYYGLTRSQVGEHITIAILKNAFQHSTDGFHKFRSSWHWIGGWWRDICVSIRIVAGKLSVTDAWIVTKGC